MTHAWYRLLPFQFDRMDDGRYLCTSLVGDHAVIIRSTLEDLLNGKLAPDQSDVDRLSAGLFLSTDRNFTEIDLLANRIRTALHARSSLAALHIIVTTLRCPNSCRYCQVSHVHPKTLGKDMSFEDADRAVDLIHSSSSPSIKIEFQGGESLLNIPVIARILERSEAAKSLSGKEVSYVIATSLHSLEDSHLELFRRFKVAVSTSLDGPAALHDTNRPTDRGSAYAMTVDGIHRCRAFLGEDQVSALMTTTRATLDQVEEVVDSYVALGMQSIFIRWLNPFGHATKNKSDIAYGASDWLHCWKRGLERILHHNRRGYPIREEFSAILLRRMLSPFPAGFVDLDNPTGSGTLVLVYNYNGDVYISDEARMLAESGDQTFRIGSVRTHSFGDLMRDTWFQEVVRSSMLECTPRCATCACQPWCGVDPTLNYATQGDIVGYRPTSEFCKRMEGTFHHLVRQLEGPDADTFRSWGLS